MSRKKISTTIYVTPEQNDKLKLLHERTKVPVAVYIREGIDLVLNHYANLLPGQLALGRTPTGSEGSHAGGGAASGASKLETAPSPLFESARDGRELGVDAGAGAGAGSQAAAPLVNDGSRAKK